MTQSEDLFEVFCTSNDLSARRVAASVSERRPDYEVIGQDGSAFVAEVKQFDPNAAELEAEAALMVGKRVAVGCEPGARLRDAISDANEQIKSWGRPDLPGMLVVYRHPVAARQHTDPYAVLTAMRGLDVVPVLIPTDPNRPPQFLATRPGPKARLTASMNRSISAVAVLRDGERGVGLSLDIFHNSHARVPLAQAAIRGDLVWHYVLNENRTRWGLVNPA